MSRTCPGFCLQFQVPTIKQKSWQGCFPSSSLNSSVCLHLYLQTTAQGQLCFHFILGGRASCRNWSCSPSSAWGMGNSWAGRALIPSGAQVKQFWYGTPSHSQSSLPAWEKGWNTAKNVPALWAPHFASLLHVEGQKDPEYIFVDPDYPWLASLMMSWMWFFFPETPKLFSVGQQSQWTNGCSGIKE